MRWWFRAVAGGELRGDAGRVRGLERSVFGGTDSDDPKEASSALRVLARVIRLNTVPDDDRIPFFALSGAGLAKEWQNESQLVLDRLRLAGTNPLGYLGYGPIGHRGGQ
jgi:hypothetical protein